ncbi:hypothetical protein OPV22_031453 [Ensete ventricosum]|uniref:Uncharacterized protein n=1 Tax=Ensete ventricosum TaxID=4639 RepID=A0AAV8PSU9_ENSVE|nr:hypothetical protein OPV22_031453 [Ensete ventricosum]
MMLEDFSPIRSLLSFPPRRSASNKPFLLSPPPNKQLIADVSSSNSRDGGRSIREWRSATGDAVSQSCHLPKASPEPSKPRLNPKIRWTAELLMEAINDQLGIAVEGMAVAKGDNSIGIWSCNQVKMLC